MKTKKISFLVCLFATAMLATAAYGKTTRVANAVWSHDELYGTVITPTTFIIAPPIYSTDVLYDFTMSGLMGQRSVSETAPGYQDYNGGRWNVQMVSFTPQGLAVFDANNDGYVDFEITNAEEILQYEASGDLVINVANFYFVCPLIRGK